MKRKYYWVHTGHLESGEMALLEPKKIFPRMVRVKVTRAPIKKRK